MDRHGSRRGNLARPLRRRPGRRRENCLRRRDANTETGRRAGPDRRVPVRRIADDAAGRRRRVAERCRPTALTGSDNSSGIPRHRLVFERPLNQHRHRRRRRPHRQRDGRRRRLGGDRRARLGWDGHEKGSEARRWRDGGVLSVGGVSWDGSGCYREA